MKNKLKTTIFGLAMMSALVSTSVFAAHPAGKGGETGSGGGLIKREGNVITIASAGLRMRLRPLEPRQIPGLAKLLDVVDKSSLSQELINRLRVAIAPTLERQYFSVDESSFSQEKLEKLRALYAQKLNVPVAEIVLGGLTEGKETYLLPAFFDLKKPQEQSAILYHESAWVLNPSLSYDEVLDLEAGMQRYIESSQVGYCRDLYDGFRVLLGVDKLKLDGIAAALKADRAAQRPELSLESIMGNETGWKPINYSAALREPMAKNPEIVGGIRSRLNAFVSLHPDNAAPYEIDLALGRLQWQMTNSIELNFTYELQIKIYVYACYQSLKNKSLDPTELKHAKGVVVTETYALPVVDPRQERPFYRNPIWWPGNVDAVIYSETCAVNLIFN